MHKLSHRHIYKLSKRDYGDIIAEMKDKVKKDPDVIKKFQEYNVPINDIDKVYVDFKELPVSAKTKNKKIYLNIAMLDPKTQIKDPSHYLAHELTHYLQQRTGNTEGHNAVDEYLDKPTEQEAFALQLDYKERHEGKEEADEYLENLLDHHDYHGKERKEKRKELKDRE